MHALEVIGDPVRRRILELLADGEVAAGDIGRIVQAEFGISQPAVSQHLRVLRETGFASVRPEGTRRLYALDPAPIAEAAAWFTPFERFWRGPLDALGTELARGARTRRRAAATEPSGAPEASGRHSDPAAPATPTRPAAPRRPGPGPSAPSTPKEH
ncbi:ArsR/SmtB family transcription factor [Agromyces aerolatus]|uniref:ArsR/SmtB family transcription factor n=1 Tax=Agromyces sp. LY-1074 TaxID=3074080 RepID=UPI0028584ADA|nr:MULTISPECIES: metalloregulator ArsR/SmtB family transcription factor [unclassified Agromyces]MDR5701262.1 metalloregulator ArsR/SmtB family transcription factor [Agromyces sp. LY-1074]MDR5706862.1 metalloregulator ArsR/SmtB family transcription factor [Agromyces sp. LY-1358]